jgi:hypothetical protein
MRYDIVIAIKRGEHDPYTYKYNQQPVRPGKVEKVYREAINDTLKNVTRNFRHPYEGIEDVEGGWTFIISGTVYFTVRIIQKEG